MAKRILTFVGFTFAALFCLAIGLLALGGVSGGTLGCTLGSGRSINAHSDGWTIGIESDKDTATIRTSGYTIVVAPAQLKVNGALWAPIDPAIKSIDVTVEDGEIAIVADGAVVPPKRR